MKVLQLVKTGVGATWAVRQVRDLVSLGVEVHVAVPGGPRVDDYRRVGAVVHVLDLSLPVRRPAAWPTVRQDLRQLLREVRPDLLHSHFVSTTLAARLALGRRHPLPRIFGVPGPLHLENPATRAVEIRSAGPRDTWIASCRWTQQAYLDHGIEPHRVHLAYYGIDGVDGTEPQPTRTCPPGLIVDDQALLVGMVAYMYPPKRYLGQRVGLKGHEDLVDAMVLVRQERPEALVVFVGGAWGGAHRYEQRVRNYARKRLGPGAIFLGTRNDVTELYRHFRVAVHPSHSENLGGAAESMLLGVPTVASDVGGFPDLIADGVTGLLTPAHSPTSLARAILSMLSDETAAGSMAVMGQRHARTLMNPMRNAAAVKQAYLEAL